MGLIKASKASQSLGSSGGSTWEHFSPFNLFFLSNSKPGGQLVSHGSGTTGLVTGALVTGAEVTGAEVTGAEVIGADVTGAELTGARVTGAEVTGALVTGADVTGADVTGADVIMRWQTGYPFGITFNRGYPRYNPGEFSTVDVLVRGDCDAAFIIGADPGATMPQPAIEHLKRIPTICLDPHVTHTSKLARVHITTAPQGIAAEGTAYRMDEIPMPLKPALKSPDPSDDVLV